MAPTMTLDNHLISRLEAARVQKPQTPLFLLDDDVVPYGQFFDNARRMAAGLSHLGLQPGDRLAVQAPKTIAMLELYIATVMTGSVFLPLNVAYTPGEISYFLQDATPRLFVCATDKLQALEPVARSAQVAHILTISHDGGGTLAGIRDCEKPDFTPFPRKKDDLAAILYTSGTTGRSKGAMLTHGALSSNSETLADLWRFTDQDILIHALPIFHTHGLFVATNIVLLAGASMHFLEKFDAQKVCNLMPHATSLMGVPTFYTRLLECPELDEAARGMRLFISGSAPLLAETHRKWRMRTGHAILERYGMTETNMNSSNPYEGERRPGTVGLPLPDVALRITDPQTGVPVQQGEIGVIEVRGPNLFAGYWQMPDKTRREMREDGFFITGDMAQQDEDGYIHLVGRCKDLIICGGFNVYPKEVELTIDAVDAVLESAVIGIPHSDLGEAVVAIVVPKQGRTIDSEKLTAHLQGVLARFKQPRHIFCMQALPRNAMGKVQKNLLREKYADVFAS